MEPPIQLSVSDWQETRRVLSQELPNVEVWAFGSRARRTAKPYSDLDLAIVHAQPMSLAAMASLQHAFESSDMTIRVDIVDWASAGDTFRKIIAQDKIIVQALQA